MLMLDDITVLRGDFSLTAHLGIPKGARIAVLGPSGSGKSTLLSLIGGFLIPQTGRVLWRGTDITSTTPSARPTATIFQDNNLFPHLDVMRNVGLGLRPDGRLTRDDRDRVVRSLRDVGLDGMGPRKPGALSGGQQSRVALARAMLQDKEILLLDEAFSALGPALKSEMIALVLRLADEKALTLVMITHDPDDARQLGGQTILVADGVAQDPRDTGDLLTDPPPALRAYLTP